MGQAIKRIDGQPCDHPDAVPVESAGDVVAMLCPACDVQLPARWLACDHEAVDVSAFGDWHRYYLCVSCGGLWSEQW